MIINVLLSLIVISQTYIVTQRKEVTEFCFDGDVSAFTCGNYTLDGETVPVLVYVTFGGRIVMYFNIKILTGMNSHVFKYSDISILLIPQY